MVKILFVCNANCNRSPTFEKYFSDNYPKLDVRSCGIYYGYPFQLDRNLLEWADEVYVMTLPMAKHISQRYPQHVEKVVILGIEDIYNPHDPQLIELIQWFETSRFWKHQQP